MDGGEQDGESSAKRRERLLALRSAAAAAAAPSSSPDASSSSLPPAASFDLPGPSMMDPATPRPPPRFDYYTNPAAAFSSSAVSHKRKGAYPSSTSSPARAPPYAGPGNCDSNYPPHQHHMAPLPMAPDAPGSSPWRSPMQFDIPTPMSGYRGTPGPPPHWNPHSASPAQGSYPHSPGFGCENPNLGRGGSPLNYRPRGSQANYGPRGSPMSYGPMRSPMSYGPRGGPYSFPGRGGGQSYSSSSSGGRGGRGGFGFQNRTGWQDRKSYYNKCMVDDPWQDLQPIVGNILMPRDVLISRRDGPESWLPESLRAKDTSDQGQIKSTSGLSLAEYLNLSYNEACNKT